MLSHFQLYILAVTGLEEQSHHSPYSGGAGRSDVRCESSKRKGEKKFSKVSPKKQARIDKKKSVSDLMAAGFGIGEGRVKCVPEVLISLILSLMS